MDALAYEAVLFALLALRVAVIVVIVGAIAYAVVQVVIHLSGHGPTPMS